jgi:2-polyprenyl-3-methyl-5-hydroxy-6-metoxy-1,4-benzoquinol methylase
VAEKNADMKKAMENNPHQKTELAWTGERVVPDVPGTEDLFLLHWARYSFAIASLPAAGRVLDLGCGAGYGTHLLATGRPDLYVLGMDLGADAVAYAAHHYQLPNLRYIVGNALSCPFSGDSFDAIVSFEVFEHLDTPPKMLEMVRWLLKPDGIFIVSTPNRDVYSAGYEEPWNPYHTQEFSAVEFETLLRAHFAHIGVYGQQHAVGSLIWKDERLPDVELELELAQSCPLSQATYLIALCASHKLPPPQPPRLWLMGIQDLEGERKALQALVDKLMADTAYLSQALQDLQAYQDRVEGHIAVRLWRLVQRTYAEFTGAVTRENRL